MKPAEYYPHTVGRTSLARLAELMDAECPSQGWRRSDDHGDRLDDVAQRLQRDVGRGLDDVTATAASIEIGLIAIHRNNIENSQ